MPTLAVYPESSWSRLLNRVFHHGQDMLHVSFQLPPRSLMGCYCTWRRDVYRENAAIPWTSPSLSSAENAVAPNDDDATLRCGHTEELRQYRDEERRLARTRVAHGVKVPLQLAGPEL